jgi:hypothetical protein
LPTIGFIAPEYITTFFWMNRQLIQLFIDPLRTMGHDLSPDGAGEIHNYQPTLPVQHVRDGMYAISFFGLYSLTGSRKTWE